jgi:hypothetical protein
MQFVDRHSQIGLGGLIRATFPVMAKKDSKELSYRSDGPFRASSTNFRVLALELSLRISQLIDPQSIKFWIGD